MRCILTAQRKARPKTRRIVRPANEEVVAVILLLTLRDESRDGVLKHRRYLTACRGREGKLGPPPPPSRAIWDFGIVGDSLCQQKIVASRSGIPISISTPPPFKDRESVSEGNTTPTLIENLCPQGRKIVRARRKGAAHSPPSMANEQKAPPSPSPPRLYPPPSPFQEKSAKEGTLWERSMKSALVIVVMTRKSRDNKK